MKIYKCINPLNKGKRTDASAINVDIIFTKVSRHFIEIIAQAIL